VLRRGREAVAATASAVWNVNERHRPASKNADFSRPDQSTALFGTWGSQVQILPLRPFPPDIRTPYAALGADLPRAQEPCMARGKGLRPPLCAAAADA